VTSVIAGALILVIAGTLFTSSGATKGIGSASKIGVGMVRWVTDPTVPGIPDLRPPTVIDAPDGGTAKAGKESSGAGVPVQ
jgi:hypothetical protein